MHYASLIDYLSLNKWILTNSLLAILVVISAIRLVHDILTDKKRLKHESIEPNRTTSDYNIRNPSNSKHINKFGRKEGDQ